MASSTEFILKKCGVKLKPAAIVIFYEVMDTGKLHRRTMPLRNLTKHSGIPATANDLRNNPRHKKYLTALPQRQLEKLIMLIQDSMKGLSLKESLGRVEELEKIDPNEDLNVVDEETLRVKKTVMEETFEKNRKKPGDADYEYEIEVNFEQGAIESCEWDSEGGSDPEF